jgi:hypothetical protein
MTARRFASAILTIGAFAAAPLLAQKPADTPKNATAQCTDGTYSTAKTERGACSKHGGVKTWWGTSTKAGASAKSTTPAPKTTTAPPKGASPATGGTAATANPPTGSTGQCADGT